MDHYQPNPIGTFKLITIAQLVDPNFVPTQRDEVIFEAIARTSVLSLGGIDQSVTVNADGSSTAFNVPPATTLAAGMYRVDASAIVTATTAATGTSVLRLITAAPVTTINSTDTLDLTTTDMLGHSFVFYTTGGAASPTIGLFTSGFTTGSASVSLRATITQLS